jgi:hypothetical protein
MIKEAGGSTMPATPGLTRELAGAIVDLIGQRSGGGQAAATPPPEEPPFTPAEVARGRDLFAGSSTLSAAGPACIACHESGAVHTLGSGRLGPDLTHVIDRLGGRRGLTAWLGAPPTPMMRAVYRPAPLTREEVRGLTAFLEQSNAVAEPRAAQRRSTFSLTAVIVAAAALALIGVVWAKRFRAVRRPLLDSTRGPVRAAPRNAPGALAAGTVRHATTAGDAR